MFERMPLNPVSIDTIKSLYRFRLKEDLANHPLQPGEWYAWKDPKGSGLYAIYIEHESNSEVIFEDIELLSTISV